MIAGQKRLESDRDPQGVKVEGEESGAGRGGGWSMCVRAKGIARQLGETRVSFLLIRSTFWSLCLPRSWCTHMIGSSHVLGLWGPCQLLQQTQTNNAPRRQAGRGGEAPSFCQGGRAPLGFEWHPLSGALMAFAAALQQREAGWVVAWRTRGEEGESHAAGGSERFGNGNVQATAATELRGGEKDCRGRGCCLPSQTLRAPSGLLRGRLIFASISATESLPPSLRGQAGSSSSPPSRRRRVLAHPACFPAFPYRLCTLPVVGIPAISQRLIILSLPPRLSCMQPPLASPPQRSIFLRDRASELKPPPPASRRLCPGGPPPPSSQKCVGRLWLTAGRKRVFSTCRSHKAFSPVVFFGLC